MTTVVTTFSKDGYDLYGHRMIESWLKYWPNNFTLVVYTEGYSLDEKDSRLIELDINRACPQLEIFKTQSWSLISDREDKKHVSRIKKTIKWCHKVFAMHHALNNFTSPYIIFLDGDTYTKNIIDKNLAEKLVQDHLFAVHFENNRHGLHFETGLISFNMDHVQMPTLKKELASGYVNLSIYKHKKTWDGFWFVHLYKTHKLDVFDLAEGKHSGVFTNPLISKMLVHEAGNEKYEKSGKNFDKYSGRIKK